VDDDGGELRSASLLATVSSTVMIAAFVGSKATRDALFLDIFSAAELPKAMLASALLSAVGVIVMSQGMSRFGPAKLVPVLFGVSAVGFGAEYSIADTMPGVAAAVVYLHVAVLSSLLISGFWSVVTERFDPHTAKRVVARVTAGATSGGLIGGLLAERVAAWLDTRSMLLVLAVMNAVTGLGVFMTGRGTARRNQTDAGGIAAGLSYMRRTPYLKQLAILVTLIALMSGLIDFVFKAEASRRYIARDDLMTFFAIFYTVTGLVTFLGQTLLSRRALDKLGIGGTIALLPATVLLGSVVGAAFTRVWTVVVVRGLQSVLENSLYTSGYQLLFTPLTPEQKRPTKTLIDVGFDRFGGALGSGFVIVVLALQPRATLPALIGAGCAALVSLFVAVRLHRGYVAELAHSLELGRVQLDEQDIIDATTRRTLADTTMAMDRDQLLAEIEALRQKSGDDENTPGASSTLISASEEDENAVRSIEEHPLYDSLSDLLSDDSTRVRRVLRPPLPRELVAWVVPLLGRDDVARSARRVLRQAAPRILGQLVDALNDEDQGAAVRRRLPEIIASVASPRAAAGLLAALETDDSQVRERVARAFSDLIVAEPSLRPDRDAVFEAVGREVRREEIWVPRVFMLLELTLPRDPLRLGLAALRSDDPNLRGTSYEYLENVLPDGLRKALWPHLHAYAGGAQPRPAMKAPRRSNKQLVDALKQSTDALHIDVLRDAVGDSLAPNSDD
jgi:ATP:ADP antiporter, AAA family